MDQTIYFGDKTLMFTNQAPAANGCASIFADTESVSRTKIVKILETSNFLSVISHDPQTTFAAFAAEFTPVVAAGGIVVNDRGEWLMMRRNDRWDLPKGHLECDERLDECAAREISEETGVEAEVVCPLCETLHAYYFPKTLRWELKRTHWYLLHAVAASTLCPQTEEGIECVAWCSPQEVAENLREAFPTIRCVAEALKTKNC